MGSSASSSKSGGGEIASPTHRESTRLPSLARQSSTTPISPTSAQHNNYTTPVQLPPISTRAAFSPPGSNGPASNGSKKFTFVSSDDTPVRPFSPLSSLPPSPSSLVPQPPSYKRQDSISFKRRSRNNHASSAALQLTPIMLHDTTTSPTAVPPHRLSTPPKPRILAANAPQHINHHHPHTHDMTASNLVDPFDDTQLNYPLLSDYYRAQAAVYDSLLHPLNANCTNCAHASPFRLQQIHALHVEEYMEDIMDEEIPRMDLIVQQQQQHAHNYKAHTDSQHSTHTAHQLKHYASPSHMSFQPHHQSIIQFAPATNPLSNPTSSCSSPVMHGHHEHEHMHMHDHEHMLTLHENQHEHEHDHDSVHMTFQHFNLQEGVPVHLQSSLALTAENSTATHTSSSALSPGLSSAPMSSLRSAFASPFSSLSPQPSAADQQALLNGTLPNPYNESNKEYVAYQQLWHEERARERHEATMRAQVRKAEHAGLIPKQPRNDARSLFLGNPSAKSPSTLTLQLPPRCSSPLGHSHSPTIFAVLLNSNSRASSRNTSPLQAQALQAGARAPHSPLPFPHSDVLASASPSPIPSLPCSPEPSGYCWIPSDLAMHGAVPIPLK